MNSGVFFICLCMSFAFAKASMPGGWSNVPDLDSPEILKESQKAAALVSKSINSEQYLKLIKVTNAKTQVVSGKNYDFDMIIGPTECTKSENLSEQQIEDCPFQKCGTPLECSVRMWVQVWTNTNEITRFNCQPGQPSC